jgi:quercetin dioxygenase-like cupin family protein
MTEDPDTAPLHRSIRALVPDTDAPWGRIRWLANDELAGVGATVGYVEIEAGASNPLHLHPNCSEILVLLEGALTHRVGEKSVDLVADDVVVIPAGVPHQATNVGSTTARMLVAYDAGVREFVRVEDA